MLVNAKNEYKQFTKRKCEYPRKLVLENFKKISRIMTSNFLGGREFEYKLKTSMVEDEEVRKWKAETEYNQQMIRLMKKLHSPRATFKVGSQDGKQKL